MTKSEKEIDNQYSHLKRRLDDYECDILKIKYLLGLNERQLSLLITNASSYNAYNVQSWCEDKELNSRADEALKVKGHLDPELLISFANKFLKDAIDACNVSKYEAELEGEQVNFNFALRQFRQRHPWLLKNPTNNIRKDYFARKLLINGAKDTGDWGDKGDLVNCNTIYYGWRTSPDERKQIFVIANMEGKPLLETPLNLFMNQKGEWKVILQSPNMKNLPKTMTKDYRIKNFMNGDILILERDI